MKILGRSIFLFLLVVFIGFIGFSIYYLSKVNFGTEVRIYIPKDRELSIRASSPTGGHIRMEYDSAGNCYYNKGRFYRDLLFIGDTAGLHIIIRSAGGETSLNAGALIKRTDGGYSLQKNLLPAYTFGNKLHDLKSIDLYRQFFFRISGFIRDFLKYASIAAFLSLLAWFIYSVIHKRVYIKARITQYISDIKEFTRRQKLKLLLPLFISFLPGSLYVMSDRNLSGFLNNSSLLFVLLTAIILLPFLTAIYFSKPLKLNRWFWISFVLIFLLNYFVLFPKVYLYGAGFRDDISKFFVKACQHGFFNDLFTPNSGYLCVLQSFIPYTLYKVLGFKYYFPEVLQLTTVLISSLLFASFNLKIFRGILPDDRYRFGLSLIFGLLKLSLPLLIFTYEIPYIAAVLLWLLLFRLNAFSRAGYIFFVLFSVIFILSKPVFIVYIPVMLGLFLHGFIKNNRRHIFSSLIWLACILIQILIIKGNPVGEISEYIKMGLGTASISDFRTGEIPMLNNVILAIYVYIRLAYMILLPYFAAGWQQIPVNCLMGCILIFIIIFLLYRYIKYRKQTELLLLTGNFLAIISTFLFVKTVALPLLSTGTSSILEMSFTDLLQSDYLVSYHRYLVLGFIPISSSMIYVLFIIMKSLIKKHYRIIIAFFILLLSFNRIFLLVSGTDAMGSKSKFRDVFNYKPAASAWRQNAELIFNFPDSYYIPYYGYPTQSESIRNGIDRITDINVSSEGSVLFDSLPFDTHKWRIIELITEYDSDLAGKLEGVVAVSRHNDSVYTEPYYPIYPDRRFIIFRFNHYIYPKEIKFVDGNYNKLVPRKIVRLVGKYE